MDIHRLCVRLLRTTIRELEAELESEGLYLVEKIVGKRVRNGHVEYLIKWQNYSSSENTWEPIENLNCPILVVEFENRLRRQLQLDEI